MRYLILILASTMAFLSIVPSAAAFEPRTTVWLEDEFPVPYAINERGSDDLSIEQLETLNATSFAAWTDVPCTAITVEYQGLTATETALDQEHVMSFVEEGWTLGPQVLGATGTSLVGVNPVRITADITYNGEFITWQIGGGGPDITIIDPQSVFTHEIGHFLGLGHTTEDGSATMADTYTMDLHQRTLSHDDKWGICHQYPLEGSTGECDLANDTCPEGSTCETRDLWNFCIEERDGTDAFCNVDRMNCQEICVFTKADLSEGFCTRECAVASDCDDDSVCRAFGTTHVCRLKTVIPDDLGGEDVAEPSEDTSTGFEIGIVEEPDTSVASEDTTPQDDASTDVSAQDTSELIVESGDDDDGCGCQVRHGGDGPLGTLPLGLGMLLGLALWVRRRRRRPAQ